FSPSRPVGNGRMGCSVRPRRISRESPRSLEHSPIGFELCGDELKVVTPAAVSNVDAVREQPVSQIDSSEWQLDVSRFIRPFALPSVTASCSTNSLRKCADHCDWCKPRRGGNVNLGERRRPLRSSGFYARNWSHLFVVLTVCRDRVTAVEIR